MRQTESMVQELIDRADADPLTDGPAAGPAKPARHSRGKNDQVAALEQDVPARPLGCAVSLSHNARGRGRLVIQFRNHEEFERLKKHICGG